MKRLRELEDSADPIEARAARLLASRAPVTEDVARKQRVRARLRRPRRASGHSWVLRIALTLLVVCSVAIAGAAVGRVGRTWIVRYRESHEAPKAARPPRQAIAPVKPVPEVPVVPVAAKPLVARHAAKAPAALPPPSAPTSTEEQRLLASGLRALRHDHNPQRAADLFARCLSEYPDSAAAEDTFALALEATVGRDPERAAELAGDYLERFPAGRWAKLARSALPR